LGALSVVAMLAVLVVQVATGLVQLDEDDFVEGPLASVVDYETSVLAHEVHEVSFNVLLGLMALHLLAVAYYVLVRRRGLVRAMITGRGELPDGVSPMQPASGRSLLACAVAAFGLTAAIVGAVPVFVD
jgi:cytochrome b